MRTLRTHFTKILFALLALAICTGATQAATLVGPTSPVVLTCDTQTGPVPAQIGIKLAATGALTVTPTITTGSTAMAAAPAAASVTSTTTATNFTFSVAAGCANATNGQAIVITFTPGTGTALQVNATLNITGPTLVLSTSAIALSCDMAAGPGAPQTVGVKLKAANSYAVTLSANPTGIVSLPAGQTINSTSVYTNFSFNVVSGCGGATNGQTVTITLTPANGTAINVTATISITQPTLVSSLGSAITVPCDTLLGPTPFNIGLTLYGGTQAYTVTASSAASTVVVAPVASNSVNSTSVPVLWSVRGAAGCKGMVNNATVALTFTPTSPSGGQALTVTATLALTNSGSALALSPSAVTITCTKSGTNYSNISSSTVKVTSPANYGTPFTVDTASSNYGISTLYPYLQVTQTGATAGSTAATLSITAAAGCGALPVGNTYASVHLLDPPAADKVLSVTIQVGAAAPISASAVSLTYLKGSYTYNSASSTLTGSNGTFYMVDTSTLPLWLSAGASSGTLSSNSTLAFTPTAGAETLALGTYSATVHLKVSGDLDSTVAVTLQVKSASSTLVVAEAHTQNIQWILGSPLPTLTLTPISTSDSPIPYTIATAATANGLVPQVASNSGLAYSFGPGVPITFLQAPFSASAPGNTLSGTVTFTWTAGGGGSLVVTINIQVLSPAATINTFSPAALPTATSGATFTVVLTGTGFVASSNAELVTTVGVVSGAALVADANITPTVVNATTIDLQITVPSSPDPFLPFSGAGGSLKIGVCNPSIGAPCFAPTSQVTVNIGINPIVQAVTSASSFLQATPPALMSIAPYDILSIFGTNFCVSNATGCVNPAILYGSTDPNTLGYRSYLSPDPAGSTQRQLTVTFQTHGSSPSPIAVAPLLFATNSQINLLVPEAVKAYYGNTVDIVVSFGYGNGANLLSSTPYSVTVANTDPGMFAMGGDGQGDAAALLNSDYSLIKQTNAAATQVTNGGTSDTVLLYVTGLGVPDSDASGSGYSATCMAPGTYFAAVNTAAAGVPGFTSLTSDDGLVLQSSLYPASTIQPCIKATSPNLPTVTVGGVPATVGFAGWVTGSVAGLYQLNIVVPPSDSSFTNASGTSVTLGSSAVALPVVVTSNGVTSQPSGVNLWVIKRLNVTPSGTTGSVGTAWAGTTWTILGGTAPYTYSATGSLPDGLTLNADGTITGTPASDAVTSTVVVTVTDHNGVTGTATVTFTIS